MAFVLVPSVCGGCTTITYEDATGAYNDPDNLGGYGGPGAPTAPSEFSEYTLSIWFPGSSTLEAADYTLNLLGSIPTPDADGHYTWPAITLTDLDLDVLTSGIYTSTITAVFDSSNYGKTVVSLFTADIEGKIRSAINESDWNCACAEGCADPMLLWNTIKRAKLAACCGQATKAQEIIDYLYNNLPCPC